jgi:hypothetical protein
MFSSKSFIILALTFKSAIDYEFMLGYSVRKAFNFILLYVDIQLSQHHLLKRSFSNELVWHPH